MMVPQTLYNINAFIGGISFAGDVPSFTLPKVGLKTEEIRNGGMDAPVDMDQGMNKLDLSWTMTGIRKEALKIYGLASGSSLDSSWRGSFKDSPEPGLVRVTVLSRSSQGVPGEEVLEALREQLNAEDIRPLGVAAAAGPALRGLHGRRGIGNHAVICRRPVDLGRRRLRWPHCDGRGGRGDRSL